MDFHEIWCVAMDQKEFIEFFERLWLWVMVQGRPPWLFAIQQQSTVFQSGHIQFTSVWLMSS